METYPVEEYQICMPTGTECQCRRVPHNHRRNGTYAHAHGLFALPIPSTNNEHPSWADAALQHPKEEALGVQALVVEATRRTHQTCAPKEDDAEDDSLNGKALGEDYGWICTTDESKIEYCSAHRVSVADNKIEICPKTEKCL